ncbi:TetR/AcrR family transcriptional regulator [Streptomyces sp. NPDC002514]|uniref:TetR/AcrR family transcriptional regulator n=1 Tax=unclassified Streptomyces TaxID=2593676 RepID=UPI0036A90A9A
MSDGVRELGKARRREAILRAAITLFAERGFETTTIADIAERAEVSARTVTLYFPSKLDLALTQVTSMTERLAATLRVRRVDQSALDALEQWLREELTSGNALDEVCERMLDLNPDLKAIANARVSEVVEEGARRLAEETGGTPHDFGPRMVAAAAAAIVAELLRTRETAGIEAAMAFLRAGLATLSER